MHKKIPQNSFTLYIKGQENLVPIELLEKTNIHGQNIESEIPVKDISSSLVLVISGSPENPEYLHCSVAFNTPNKSYVFDSSNILLSLRMGNELEKLRDELAAFVDSKDLDKYRFEPIETSFELNFEKVQDEEIKLTIWVDNTNADLGIYSWDAVGMRMFTNVLLIKDFLKELNVAINSLA